MKMQRLAILVFCYVTVALLTASCDRVKPKPPEPTLLQTQLIPPLSTVVIPVYYHVDSLAAIINAKLKGTFMKKWLVLNDKGDSLYVEITRLRKVRLNWKQPELRYDVPLHVSAKFIIKRVGKVKIKNATPVETEVVVHMATEVGINKDWNLKPNSRLVGVDWEKDPVLKVGLVKVNLRKIVDDALHEHQAELVAKMDETLQGLLNTRKVIEKIWNDLQKPIRINKKEVQVWLKPYAKDLKAKLAQDGRFIVLAVELKASVETVVEGDNMPESNRKLPPYKPKVSANDSLQIFVLATIPFKKANELLERQLKGKKIEAEGYSTTLKDIAVYGTDKGLAVKVNIRGDIDGKLYLTGTPFYDSATSTFHMKDFGFDVDSENSLVNSADWMLHDHAIDFIQEKLSVDLKPLIEQLPGLIINGVEKGKSGEKINIYIDHLQVVPQQLVVTRDNIQVILKGTGKAAIGLQKKVFANKKGKKARG